jgi:hypothetical protein
LAKLPKNSNIFEPFKKASDLSGEEAFFEFIERYDVTLREIEICQITCKASLQLYLVISTTDDKRARRPLGLWIFAERSDRTPIHCFRVPL